MYFLIILNKLFRKKKTATKLQAYRVLKFAIVFSNNIKNNLNKIRVK